MVTTTFVPLWLPSLRMEKRQRGKAKENQSRDRQDETNREAPKPTQKGELAENKAFSAA